MAVAELRGRRPSAATSTAGLVAQRLCAWIAGPMGGARRVVWAPSTVALDAPLYVPSTSRSRQAAALREVRRRDGATRAAPRSVTLTPPLGSLGQMSQPGRCR
jgi:hypothetical protein